MMETVRRSFRDLGRRLVDLDLAPVLSLLLVVFASMVILALAREEPRQRDRATIEITCPRALEPACRRAAEAAVAEIVRGGGSRDGDR